MKDGKRLSRRDFLKVTAGVAGGAILTAYGSTLTPGVIEKGKIVEAMAENPDKLVFWHMYFDDDANKGLVVKDFANIFQSSTGIEVELSQVVWTDHIKRMGVVGAAQDKTPDIFISGLAAPGLQGMVGGDYVMPLDDLVTPEELEQYLPPLLEQCKVDGKLYAFPQESQVFGMIYNKKVFEDLGIEKPTTLDELEAAMDKMVAADIIPIGVVAGTGSFAAEWLFQALSARVATQAEMDAITKGEAKFSDKMLVVEEVIERWGQKGYYGPNVLANEWDPEVPMMYEGKIAMMVMGGFWPAQTKEQFHQEDLDYGILVPPPLVSDIPKQVAGGLWWGISVNARSDYPEWAVRLAMAMSGKGFSEQWLRRTFNLAAGAVDKELITFTPLREYLEILSDHATTWFNVPAAIGSDYANTQLELVANQITAQEAADRIDGLFASL